MEFIPSNSRQLVAPDAAGAVQKLTFMYDTQGPELEPEAIRIVVTEPEVNNALMEIHADLTDNSAGIDWENLEEEWITFERLSPNATQISGRRLPQR